MAEALICLRSRGADLQNHLRSILQNWKVRVCASMDDVFDHLWESGGDVDLVVSDLAASFQEELFDAAGNWPDLLFVAVSDRVSRPARAPVNLVVLKRRDMRSEILSRIDRWERRQGALRLDHGPAD